MDVEAEGDGEIAVKTDVIDSGLRLPDRDGKVGSEGGVAIVKVKERGHRVVRDVHVAIACGRLVDDELGRGNVSGAICDGHKLEPHPTLLRDARLVRLIEDGGDHLFETETKRQNTTDSFIHSHRVWQCDDVMC